MVNYLAKRPNFDILKILFAKRLILVEGPTEEMFINTFLDKEVEYLNEIEVIAIGQKGYKTFLDIWLQIHKEDSTSCIGVARDYDNQPNAKKEHQVYDDENKNIFVRTTEDVYKRQVQVKVMKAKKNYAYAKLEKVLVPSPFRVQPPCPFHRQCGGCQLQPLSYEKQLEFKQNKIRNNLIRIGGFSPEHIDACMEPIIGMEDPWHYRNKAQFPFGYDLSLIHILQENRATALGIIVLPP